MNMVSFGLRACLMRFEIAQKFFRNGKIIMSLEKAHINRFEKKFVVLLQKKHI